MESYHWKILFIELHIYFSLQVYGDSTPASVKVLVYYFPRQNHYNHRLDIVLHFGTTDIKGSGKNHTNSFVTRKFTIVYLK